MENVAACGEAADAQTSVEVEKPAPSATPVVERAPLARRRAAFLRPGVLSRRSRRRAR